MIEAELLQLYTLPCVPHFAMVWCACSVLNVECLLKVLEQATLIIIANWVNRKKI